MKRWGRVFGGGGAIRSVAHLSYFHMKSWNLISLSPGRVRTMEINEGEIDGGQVKPERGSVSI